MRRGVLIVLVVAVFAGVFGFPAQAQVPACTNDLFDDAIEVTALDYSSPDCDTSTAGTAGEPAAQGCEVGTGLAKTVWWKYTPTVATQTHVKINTYLSSFNTVVALYEDTGSGLTLLACNNNVTATNTRSRVVQALQLNHTYYVRVGGVTVGGGTGGGTLKFRLKKRLWKPGVVRGNDWYFNNAFDGTTDFVIEFGQSTDRKLVGAWAPAGDGSDGIDTPWVRRGNLWITNDWFDSTFATQFHYGASTDFPLLGDWNRDEILSPGVRRSNIWYLNNGQDGIHDISVLYGRSTDYPLVGDWDGDGIWTPGVRRGNVFYLNNNFDAVHDIAFAFGRSTDFPVVGDWNGDGKMTIGLVRGRDWFLSDGFDGVQTVPTFGWGFASDFKIVGDWNGIVE